ncbi:MAG: hypothetical protein JRJ59_10820 [Deltaproteobacteria bacterium]|nr:hypothetical protein [Deltaproteobacteria bacterium]
MKKAVIVVTIILTAGLGLGLGLNQNGEKGVTDRLALAAQTPAPMTQAKVRRFYAQALAAYYQGQYGRAEDLFQTLSSQIPLQLKDDLLFWQAECSFRQGRLIQAQTGFRDYLHRDPKGPRAEVARERLMLLGKTSG